jgi:hypothetical protein
MKKQLVFIFCLLSMIPMAQGQQWEEITFNRPENVPAALFRQIDYVACDSECIYAFCNATGIAILDRKDQTVRSVKTWNTSKYNPFWEVLPMRSSTIFCTSAGIFLRIHGQDTLNAISLPTTEKLKLAPNCLIGFGDTAFITMDKKFYRSNDGGRSWRHWGVGGIGGLPYDSNSISLHDTTIWVNTYYSWVSQSYSEILETYSPYSIIKNVNAITPQAIWFRFPWKWFYYWDLSDQPEKSSKPVYRQNFVAPMFYDDERETTRTRGKAYDAESRIAYTDDGWVSLPLDALDSLGDGSADNPRLLIERINMSWGADIIKSFCYTMENSPEKNVEKASLRFYKRLSRKPVRWARIGPVLKVYGGYPRVTAYGNDIYVAGIDQKTIYHLRLDATSNVEEMPIVQDGVEIQPNPATDIIQLTVSANAGSTYQIRDLLGRILLGPIACQSEQSIDISGFAAGLYTVHISTDKGRHYYGKFLIQR